MALFELTSGVVLAALVLREFPGLLVVLVVLWLLILGGSVGSFLNVVIYRLPQGLSLVRPASRCPRCYTPILPRDNVPVLGWLMLRGRCRACRAPIAPRYPAVELTMALIFLGLAWCEAIAGGVNLPIVPRQAAQYPLWGMAVYHFALMCGMAAAALMQFDGEAVPRRFWFVVWLIGFAAGLGWPLLRPVGVDGLDPAWGLWLFGLVEGLAGTLVGIVLGCAAWPASTAVGQGRDGNMAGPALTALVGVFLGWQAAAVVSVVAAVVWASVQLVRYLVGMRRNLGWSMIAAVAALAWLLAWRAILQLRPNLGEPAPWLLAPAALGLTFVAALAGRILADAAGRRTSAS